MTDKDYLLSNGWTVARAKNAGFIRRVFWTDPKVNRECDQQLALYVQAKRDAAQQRPPVVESAPPAENESAA